MLKMDFDIGNPAWDAMSLEEKNNRLFLEQKETLKKFLERGAISQAEHDRSLCRLKKGETT